MNAAERFLAAFQTKGARQAIEAMAKPLGANLNALAVAKAELLAAKSKQDDPALRDILDLAAQWLHYQANIADEMRRQDGPPSEGMMTNVRDRASIEKSLERAHKRYQRSKTACETVVRRYLDR